MKTFKRVLIVILAAVVLVVAAGMIYLNHLKTRSIPDYSATIDLENLSEPVTVFRDSLGIPHIYASNDPDLYRAIGFVMAQDRLWQMDLLRRITTGRLSEVLDPSLVDVDQLFRALRFQEKSEKVLRQTDPAIVECLEAFSDGVNQYIEQNAKKLPFEFGMLRYKPEPWEPVHTFNLIGYMAWDLSSGMGEELALFKMQQAVSDTLFRELLPNMKYQSIPAFPDFMLENRPLEMETALEDMIRVVNRLGLRIFEASNNWAVSGERSESGKPMMANDMHLGLMAPGIWYQMHQVVNGSMNVTGVVLPGAPFVICGHNEDISWGMTNVTVDDIDFYLETINPKDTNQYLVDGSWRNMVLKEESIPVKGEDEPVIRINRFTHRGPVVSGFQGISDRVISARWQGNGFSNEVRSVYLLNRARNWEDFRNALTTFTSISQNVVYADRNGNIGLQTAAGIPIRQGEGILVYPGDTSLYDWTGQVPFEELPFSFNPASGYVSSANNRTVGEEYPYYIGTWFSLPYRIGRIREMLDEKQVFGIDDFKRMQRDQVSHFARQMVPVYLEALDGKTEGIYTEARTLLEDWDYSMDASSPAGMIFDVMWLELNRVMFQDELGDDLYPNMLRFNSISRNLVNRVRITGRSLWCDDVTTPGIKEGFQDNIIKAFHRTVDTLAVQFGGDPASWQWGDLHKVSFMHPLGTVKIVDRIFKVNRGPYPVGGSFHTVCPYSYPLATSFISDHGASERHIFVTADWDRSLTVIPTGISGVPASDYYMNQTEIYINNGYHHDAFSREAVEKEMRFRSTYRPPER